MPNTSHTTTDSSHTEMTRGMEYLYISLGDIQSDIPCMTPAMGLAEGRTIRISIW